MKPKYYTCFFLSLLACDQGNIEVNNAKAQDVDPKDNLLDGDSSIIDVVNNLCEGVKDIHDKNDPLSYVELTTQLVEEYANSFWSLGRCQGIFKQLCEQVPPYPSQIVYDVLYALLKSKCLGAAGVQTIIQGIKEDNPKVFSLLNNYVEKKFKTYNQGTDDSARIIAESFGFIFKNTTYIPGINTFTSTSLPPKEQAIKVDDLIDIGQCVNFIKNNGFDTNSLTKLIELAASGDFNKAIKAIAGAGIFFKDTGDEMMQEFDGKNVNLNDAGLKALAYCIPSDKKIATTDNLKKIIPSLINCTDLAPIFEICKDDFQVDANFLSVLAEYCPDNYDNLIESIPKTRFNTNGDKKDSYLKFLEDHNVCNGRLSSLFRKLPKFFPEDDFITLLKNIDLDSATSLDPLVESLESGKFNLECLKKLAEQYKDNSDKFNKVFSKISKGEFFQKEQGDDVIQAFAGKNMQLEDDNLVNVLSMIGSRRQQISDCQKAIDFCCKNIKNLNEQNIKAVFEKVGDQLFDLNALAKLWKQGAEKFNQILPYIPTKKLKQDNRGNAVLAKIPMLIQSTNITFTPGNLKKILNLCQGGTKITNVSNLYTVFCRSWKDESDVNALTELINDNSLHGTVFISKIKTPGYQPTDAQKAFVETFYSKIADNTININTKDRAQKFVWFAYIWYKQDNNLTDLKNKIAIKVKPYINGALTKDKLQKFSGQEINDDDFEAFKNKLSEVLDLNK